MYYTGKQGDCHNYNAMVSHNEGYEGAPNKKMKDRVESQTESWSEVIEIEGTYYIAKHPNYSSPYLTETELPLTDDKGKVIK